MAPHKHERRSGGGARYWQDGLAEIRRRDAVAASTTLTSSSIVPQTRISSTVGLSSRTTSSSATALQDASTSSTTTTSAATSPTMPLPVKHVLIAAAAIGGLVFLGAITYFLLRLMRIDVGACFRKGPRGGRGSWTPGPYGGKGSNTPPYATFPGEKPGPSTRKLYTPIVIPLDYTPPQPPPPTAQALSRGDLERQTLVREALRSNPVPVESGPPAYQVRASYSLQNQQQSRRPSTAYGADRQSYLSSLSSGFGDLKIDIPESGPTKPMKQRKYSSLSSGFGDLKIDISESGPTKQSRQSRQSRQSKQSRHRKFSSISSGFGDLKLDIPESGPTKPEGQRKQSVSDRVSRNNFTSRFSHSSWISNPPTPARSRSRSNRDTMYTSTSEESAPRFRTVNSWVSQQARRAQRQQDVDKEIDNMPEIPASATMAGNNHQRHASEATESIYGFHPGEEVPIAKGKRVSSKILDRII